LNIEKDASPLEAAQAAFSAGDAVMNRLYKYVKNDGGHISEQIGRNSGAQTSAKDLTWSYANILSAMQQRKKALSMIHIELSLLAQ
jgi:glucoamylase